MDEYERLANYHSRINLIKESIEYDLDIVRQLLNDKKFDHLRYFLLTRIVKNVPKK